MPGTIARPTFDALQASALLLFEAQDYAAAYDLLSTSAPTFPDQAAQIEYLRSCCAARLGDNQLAITILASALDAGCWYGEDVLRLSPSWLPLQGLAQFEALAQRSLLAASRAHVPPVDEVRVPPDLAAPTPLLIALHSNGSTAAGEVAPWASAVERGWIVALPESSQMPMNNFAVWDDQVAALADILALYRRISAAYPVDADRIVLGGFSMGAETALRASLTRTVPNAGFVLLGPGGPTMAQPDAWLPIARGAGNGIQGSLIIGREDDPSLVANARRVAVVLRRSGIACQLVERSGLAHTYPADFGSLLDRALGSIV